jgi:hypothetical protein
MRKLLMKAVELAFKSAGDLVTTATLKRRDGEAFDFLTKQITSTDLSITVPVIQIKAKKEDNHLGQTLVFKTKDVPEIDHYDFLELSGITYRIAQPIEINDYITRLTAYRDQ